MANWDEIVTDPRLTLDLVERHVQTIETDTYLFDEFHVVASGGSSGVRGVFAWGWDAWAIAMASAGPLADFRFAVTHPETMTRAAGAGHGGAEHAPTHMSERDAPDVPHSGVTVHRLPVTMPMTEIVANLNALQPDGPRWLRVGALRARARGAGRAAADQPRARSRPTANRC